MNHYYGYQEGGFSDSGFRDSEIDRWGLDGERRAQVHGSIKRKESLAREREREINR